MPPRPLNAFSPKRVDSSLTKTARTPNSSASASSLTSAVSLYSGRAVWMARTAAVSSGPKKAGPGPWSGDGLTTISMPRRLCVCASPAGGRFCRSMFSIRISLLFCFFL